MNNNFYYQTSNQYLTNCLLNLTDDCNLQCKYCFVQQKPNYMSLETAIAAVNWLYNNLQKKERLGIYDDNHHIKITFFGGEPMLCYSSIIVPLVKYCHENFPNVFSFSMTTNGTLLNQNNIQFLKENNFDILLSIDGNKMTQNYNRPIKNSSQNSFDLIYNNIQLLLQYFPNLECRATIYAPTVNELFNNYLYIESLGVKNWDMIVDSRHDWTEKNIILLKEQMAKIYMYQLEKIIAKQPIMVDSLINKWFNYTILSFKEENENKQQIYQNDIIYRCGLGTTSGAIGWDGSIFGCQEQVSKNNKNIFYIGNIFLGGIDLQKHYQLLKTYYNAALNLINIEKCQNCKLKMICQKQNLSCPSLNYDISHQIELTPNIECEMKKIYYNNSLIILKLLFSLSDKEVLKYFNSIINLN